MDINEVSPPGWSGTVAAMKQKHPELSKGKDKNPYALAWWMKKRGAKPHYKEQPGKDSKSKKKPVKKEKYKHEDKPKKDKKKGCFCEWLEANHPEYDQLKQDYANLDARTQRQLEELPGQVSLEIAMELQEPWAMFSRMLELVVKGEREAKHLAPLWNQLDEILWKEALKKPFGSKPV